LIPFARSIPGLKLVKVATALGLRLDVRAADVAGLMLTSEEVPQATAWQPLA
jgi:hypothetical protein